MLALGRLWLEEALTNLWILHGLISVTSYLCNIYAHRPLCTQPLRNFYTSWSSSSLLAQLIFLHYFGRNTCNICGYLSLDKYKHLRHCSSNKECILDSFRVGAWGVECYQLSCLHDASVEKKEDKQLDVGYRAYYRDVHVWLPDVR